MNTLKSKFLNIDKFYCLTSTGTVKLKRVSAAEEVRFPRAYRELYRNSIGPGK